MPNSRSGSGSVRLVVVDANLVVSAALKSASTPALALLAAMTEHKLAVSRAVEAEYLEVLSRPKFAKALPAARRDALLSSMLSNAVSFEPTVRVRDCRDPGDDIYLELALAADAAAIISGDADLLILSPWQGIPILTASDYLRDTPGKMLPRGVVSPCE
jgi:uncharacterized protein